MEKKLKNHNSIVHKEIQKLPDNIPFLDEKSAEFEEISLAFKQILATDNTNRLFDLIDTTMAILDIEGNILVAKKWKKICTDFHRVNADSCQKCIKSDTTLANELEDGKDYTVYRCENGMVDYASPIIIEGHHIANVYIGQYLFEEPDLSFFRANAKKYGFDEETYMEALKDVPIIDEKSNEALHYLTVISKFISVMAFEKIQAMKLEKKYHEELNKKLKEEIEQNKTKDKLLFEQSKLATMGEMIGNITHQWKQPLSLISMSNGLLKIHQEDKTFCSEEEIDEAIENINNSVNHLSTTIDDFRNFLIPDKQKVEVQLKTIYEKTYRIISSQFKNKDIKIIVNIDDVQIFGFPNEILQVLINVINNARDELIEDTTDKKRLIFIYGYEENEKVIIKIKDNAGGIPKDIISEIFKSYFTTKKDKEGTGIGLYMSKQIIESMNGIITVSNVNYEYENIEYTGAEFVIELQQ